MNKFSKLSLIIFPIITLFSSSCNNNNGIDYSKTDNWYKCENNGSGVVDLIFIYPTIVNTSLDKGDFATIEETREKLSNYYWLCTPPFESNYTNTYIPFYRQVTFDKAIELKDHYKYLDFIKENITYKDVCDSLDYYFDHYNKGKPFILAGHSQGSAILLDVLTNYMQEEKHLSYLDRMVATYAIGYGPDKSKINNYKKLKFAETSDDTGVIVSFNTYGTNHKNDSLLLATPNSNTYCINPLNWKIDETYASVSENTGTRMLPPFEPLFPEYIKTPGLADAKVNLSKGVLECSTYTEYTQSDGLFGTESLHGPEILLYYQNLKDNTIERIKAYFTKQ